MDGEPQSGHGRPDPAGREGLGAPQSPGRPGSARTRQTGEKSMGLVTYGTRHTLVGTHSRAIIDRLQFAQLVSPHCQMSNYPRFDDRLYIMRSTGFSAGQVSLFGDG